MRTQSDSTNLKSLRGVCSHNPSGFRLAEPIARREARAYSSERPEAEIRNLKSPAETYCSVKEPMDAPCNMRYKLAAGVQVREESFGLLFYNYRGPRLYFVPSKDLIDVDFFNGWQSFSGLIASICKRRGWKKAEVGERIIQILKVSTGDSFFSVSTEERRSLGLNMCGACKLTCCVSPTGEVYPCAFLQESEFRAGKLPEDSFSAIWQDSAVFHSFRRLEIKSCENCYRFDLCHGGCPAIAYHTQRKLGLPDPGCLANCVTEKPLAAVNM